MRNSVTHVVFFLLVTALLATGLQADPCGMVPPIYTGNQSPITRIGLQKTYVFYKDGVETFVIRPGFSGKVDNFGMLIPFPAAPELRKVSDNVFEHIAQAIDPPEVVVDLRIRRMMRAGGARGAMPAAADADNLLAFRQKVTVLKQEAVGMYEVAVLEAGSADALKRWMDENGYKYPEGMDKVTNEYVELGWCFVAVKTKVGQRQAVEPRPGQRQIRPELPEGSVFDGNVQGMGFRFPTEELVVPMRLSAFNAGEMRNVVYLLTDGPRKIRAIPEEYVMRQISGRQLFDNVTKPLPIRVIGGTEKDIPDYLRRGLLARRNPEPKNGVAKELFASDLSAVTSGNLSLKHEEEEKELLRVGEYFGLRGAEIDKENLAMLELDRKSTIENGLVKIKDMTLTVVDGDFPREVVANQNLTFADYRMPAQKNNHLNYDANLFGPGAKKEGIRVGVDVREQPRRNASRPSPLRSFLLGLAGLAFLSAVVTVAPKKSRAIMLFLAAIGMLTGNVLADDDQAERRQSDSIIDDLKSSETAADAIAEIKKRAEASETERGKLVKDLLNVVKASDDLSKRGWAIAALAEIGGQDVDENLLNVHADENQPQLVRTWAAAARVSNTRTVNGLIEKAQLISKFPALGRPIGMRIVEKMADGDSQVDPEKVLAVTQQVPQLQSSLASAIMAFGSEKLSNVMVTSNDNGIRRLSAGYLGSLAGQGDLPAVVDSVTRRLAFDGQAETVPWAGGALFVPSVQWNQEDARELVGSLIRWYLWCDLRGKDAEQKQIHNNIRSLGLANAAGYKSPGWNDVDCNAWLIAWGQAVGKEEIETILKEQDAETNPGYSGALEKL